MKSIRAVMLIAVVCRCKAMRMDSKGMQEESESIGDDTRATASGLLRPDSVAEAEEANLSWQPSSSRYLLIILLSVSGQVYEIRS